MRPVQTSIGSVISNETLFEFSQVGLVVSARYAGGPIVLGVLVGTMAGSSVIFRYAQVHQDQQVHGGRSECHIVTNPNGRVQLTEQFTWDSAPRNGINVFESVE